MHHLELVSMFTTRFDAAGISYMVTGSVAAMLYGEPRFTNDLDLVVALSAETIAGIIPAFPESEFYRPPTEVLIIESGRPLRGHFNIIHHQTGYKADVYLLGRDPLHEWGMANRKRISVESENVWLAPPEYVILRKLEYYREGHSEKHLLDIRGMLEVSGDTIDMPILDRFIHERSLQAEWQQALRDEAAGEPS